MQLMARGQWMAFVDLLLPASALTFLLPINPSISSIPAVVWVLIQLTFAPRERRWAAWPMMFVLMLISRSWWLNEMSHPVSFQDGLIFAAALLAGACVSQKRWPSLLISLLLISSAPMLLRETMWFRPWIPNPLAGLNQSAYLLGLISLVAAAWCWSLATRSVFKYLIFGFAAINFFLVWQIGSRASILSVPLSISIVWSLQRLQIQNLCRNTLLLFGLAFSALLAKQTLSPSKYLLPGLDVSSDMGRLEIWRCYVSIPFSGNNRFLYGIGFDRASEFCRDPIQGGVAEHAHNLYFQLFASSGILGLAGLMLLLVLLGSSWRDVGDQLDPLVSRAGHLMLTYTLIQGCFDLSLLHWPVTLVLTGLLLGIPLGTSRPAWSKSSVCNRGV